MSFTLARLIGPLLLLIVLAVALDRTRLTVAAREHLASPALIQLTAVIALVAGLAMVNSHNLWIADWRVLVTLMSWFVLINGAVRLVLPRLVQRQGNAVMNRVWPMWLGVGVALLVGAVLTWQGYFG